MNNQPGTSQPNMERIFTHLNAKIPRLEQDNKAESDDEEYLITIKEEEPSEGSLMNGSPPIPTFVIYGNNLTVRERLENSGSEIPFHFTKPKSWLMRESKNPMNYFNLFLNEEFLNSIVKATNHEAHVCQMLGFGSKPAWVNVTVSELKIFLGLWLHTGTAKMNSLLEYWQNNRLIKSCFHEYMLLERFTAILQYLSLPEKKSAMTEPQEYKAIDHFNAVMNRYFLPGRNLQLNDCGLDTFYNSCVSDLDKTGALGLNMFVMFEQGGPILKIATNVNASSSSEKEALFLNFLEGKLDCAHSLYVTPKITIPTSIAILLLKRETLCNGIFQPEVNEHSPKEEDAVFLKHVHTGPCYNYVNTNGKTTYYISTEFKGTTESGTEQAPEAIRNYIEKPQSSYFQDIRSYYPFGTTNFLQRNKVFMFILMATIKNASYAAELDFNSCRLKIIDNLLPENKPYKEKNKHRLTRIPLFCDNIEVAKHEVWTSRRDCLNCEVAKNLSRVTVYWCNDCENSPPLCVECFFDVHLAD